MTERVVHQPIAAHYPVAIVGAGPVGLTVANLLAGYGVECVLIEQSPGTAQHPRAQTIDDESMRTLQVFGQAGPFSEMIRPAQASNYYDENKQIFARIGVGPRNYGFFKRNYMLQQQLDRLLLNSVSDSNAINIRFSTRLDTFSEGRNKVELTLADGRQLTCNYLLACDGGQSPIRKALGIAMQGWTYEQDWIVLDTLDDPDTEPVSRFFCDPARPMVSIASPNNGRRYEFMLLPGEDHDGVLSDAHLAALLAPYREFDPKKITRRAVYTFHARVAEKLGSTRVFLLGDAAHLTPPFAGQGMNAGMRDALNIAWKLALVEQHQADPAILQSYETERRAPIWAMIQVAVAMGEFCMPVGAEQIALKASVMKALERFPQARDWLFNMRFKPVPRYDSGLLVEPRDQPFEASLVGEMLPQPMVQRVDGQTVLLDELLGIGFALLIQDAGLVDKVKALNHPVWQVLSPARVLIQFGSTVADTATAEDTNSTDDGVTRCRVVDPVNTEAVESDRASVYGRPIRTHRDQILLIRPDRYVAGAFFAEDGDAFADKLSQTLGLTRAALRPA